MWHWFEKFCSPRELKAQGVLGMNARNYKIIAKNNNRRQYPKSNFRRFVGFGFCIGGY